MGARNPASQLVLKHSSVRCDVARQRDVGRTARQQRSLRGATLDHERPSVNRHTAKELRTLRLGIPTESRMRSLVRARARPCRPKSAACIVIPRLAGGRHGSDRAARAVRDSARATRAPELRGKRTRRGWNVARVSACALCLWLRYSCGESRSGCYRSRREEVQYRICACRTARCARYCRVGVCTSRQRHRAHEREFVRLDRVS